MRWPVLPVWLVLLQAPIALAQDERPVLTNQGQAYQGVTPGTPNPPPRIRVGRSRRRPVVTWPGFQVSAQGSRIFVQTSQPVAIQGIAGPSRLVYRLAGFVISTRNNRNPLVTAHFNTPVTSAYLRRRGRDVELVIELRAQVEPMISNSPGENGLQFVFFEFPSGDWLPAGPPPVAEPSRMRLRSSVSVSPSSGESPEPTRGSEEHHQPVGPTP
ncbi:MAG: hypothetical protein HYY06_02530 [Deltaproteobacteria bacterium]|nr:hypothetical protein [Deltaproteobacteria bacterium]